MKEKSDIAKWASIRSHLLLKCIGYLDLKSMVSTIKVESVSSSSNRQTDMMTEIYLQFTSKYLLS